MTAELGGRVRRQLATAAAGQAVLLTALAVGAGLGPAGLLAGAVHAGVLCALLARARPPIAPRGRRPDDERRRTRPGQPDHPDPGPVGRRGDRSGRGSVRHRPPACRRPGRSGRRRPDARRGRRSGRPPDQDGLRPGRPVRHGDRRVLGPGAQCLRRPDRRSGCPGHRGNALRVRRGQRVRCPGCGRPCRPTATRPRWSPRRRASSCCWRRPVWFRPPPHPGSSPSPWACWSGPSAMTWSGCGSAELGSRQSGLRTWPRTSVSERDLPFPSRHPATNVSGPAPCVLTGSGRGSRPCRPGPTRPAGRRRTGGAAPAAGGGAGRSAAAGAAGPGRNGPGHRGRCGARSADHAHGAGLRLRERAVPAVRPHRGLAPRRIRRRVAHRVARSPGGHRRTGRLPRPGPRPAGRRDARHPPGGRPGGPASPRGPAGSSACSSRSAWCRLALGAAVVPGAPVAAASATGQLAERGRRLVAGPGEQRAFEAACATDPLRGMDAAPAAGRSPGQGRGGRLRRELRPRRADRARLRGPDDRHPGRGHPAAGRRRLLRPQRLSHLAHLRRRQLARPHHPAVRGVGGQRPPLRRLDQQRPADGRPRLPGGGLADRRGHAGQPRRLGRADLLRLRPGLRRPEPRLPGTGPGLGQHPGPVQPGDVRARRARLAGPGTAVRRAGPGVQPCPVADHSRGHGLGRGSATAPCTSRMRPPRRPTPSGPRAERPCARRTGARWSTRWTAWSPGSETYGDENTVLVVLGDHQAAPLADRARGRPRRAGHHRRR